MESSSGYLGPQKGFRKKLIDLLYKEGYCLCIPDVSAVQALLDKVNKIWLQTFLLTKNPSGFSVIPMFIVIFIKNKQLSAEACANLLDLIGLLLRQLESVAIARILFEKKADNPALVYYLFNELLQSKRLLKNRVRMQALASCLQMLLEKINAEIINDIILDSEEKGFNVIRRVLAGIAYNALDEEQIPCLVNITKRLIAKSGSATIDKRILQIQCDGFSFMWCSLAAWLEYVSESLSDRRTIEGLATLITVLLEKADISQLPEILIEKEGEGFSLMLAYVLLTTLPILSYEEKHYLTTLYLPWLEKLFSRVDYAQGEVIIEKTFALLMNNTRLTLLEKQRIESQIFGYLLCFTTLTAAERTHLSDLREQLTQQFFPVQSAKKSLLSPIRNYFSLFKQRFALRSSVYSQQLELNESTPLIRGNHA